MYIGFAAAGKLRGGCIAGIGVIARAGDVNILWRHI